MMMFGEILVIKNDQIGVAFAKFMNKDSVLAEKFLAREIFILSFVSGLSALPYDWTYTLIQKIKV